MPFRFECIDPTKNCDKYFEIDFIELNDSLMVIQIRQACLSDEGENELPTLYFSGTKKEGYKQLRDLRKHVQKFNYKPANEPAKAFAEAGDWIDWKTEDKPLT